MIRVDKPNVEFDFNGLFIFNKNRIKRVFMNVRNLRFVDEKAVRLHIVLMRMDTLLWKIKTMCFKHVQFVDECQTVWTG